MQLILSTLKILEELKKVLLQLLKCFILFLLIVHVKGRRVDQNALICFALNTYYIINNLYLESTFLD